MGQKLFKYHTFSASYYKRLNTAPQKVCQIEIESIDNYTFCVNMDSFFINAAVEELIFGSLDPWGCEMNAGDHRQIEAATRTSEVCTRVYKKLNPLEAQSIRCTYKGENDFDYGFSLQDVRSLNETFRRPMNGTSNKIYVSSSYNKNEFHHFNIIFVNGTSIAQNIPLRPMNKSDLFVGSFQPPDKGYFYIQVIRIDNGAKVLARISNAISAADGFGANHKNPTFEYRPEYSNAYFNQKPKQSSCGCGCNSKPSLSKAEDSGLSIVYLFIAVAVLATLVVGVSLYLYLTPLYNRLNSLFSRLSD
ncbi:uncharacterized protein LOC135837625 [Planococcus citri]|uniref:uncharacterized protein LOC135837625 n=1 Tax=Planococcus citri TaxID=170843 RepID=UPI0031F79C1A